MLVLVLSLVGGWRTIMCQLSGFYCRGLFEKGYSEEQARGRGMWAHGLED